jgi:hypothetical protein
MLREANTAVFFARSATSGLGLVIRKQGDICQMHRLQRADPDSANGRAKHLLTAVRQLHFINFWRTTLLNTVSLERRGCREHFPDGSRCEFFSAAARMEGYRWVPYVKLKRCGPRARARVPGAKFLVSFVNADTAVRRSSSQLEPL